ncbi:MAG TPA: D-arabinose 5-phosphate isomerase [Gammaproteobacteria bacterium]|nr:D-arabinose 5-phosphate isomerase [Gammaproteobacteria bacterium]
MPKKSPPQSPFIESAIRTIEIENRATSLLADRVGSTFETACQMMLDTKGRVIVMGMGKSGHIGNKIAATFASTGTASYFVHPAEASHGDIGMITGDDIVLALSNSGNTAEITTLLPVLKRKGIKLITLTGNRSSELALAADANIDASVSEEACPLGLAPTSSTTVTLILGDALAMALLEARGFTRDDFAMSHPGGSLGRRLLVKVKDVMHSGTEIPSVRLDSSLSAALAVMSEKGFGMTTVVDENSDLVGVFTDGDLRRTIDAGKNIQQLKISEIISPSYKSIAEDVLAAEAVKLMEEANIYVLIVKNKAGEVVGIVKMHDLLKAKVV